MASWDVLTAKDYRPKSWLLTEVEVSCRLETLWNFEGFRQDEFITVTLT